MPRRRGIRFDRDADFPARVKALRDRGLLQHEIAHEVGATQGTISKVLRAQGLGGYLSKTPESLRPVDWKKRKSKAG